MTQSADDTQAAMGSKRGRKLQDCHFATVPCLNVNMFESGRPIFRRLNLQSGPRCFILYNDAKSRSHESDFNDETVATESVDVPREGADLFRIVRRYQDTPYKLPC